MLFPLKSNHVLPLLFPFEDFQRKAKFSFNRIMFMPSIANKFTMSAISFSWRHLLFISLSIQNCFLPDKKIRGFLCWNFDTWEDEQNPLSPTVCRIDRYLRLAFLLVSYLPPTYHVRRRHLSRKKRKFEVIHVRFLLYSVKCIEMFLWKLRNKNFKIQMISSISDYVNKILSF
jgi:hypothetical protein